VWAWDFWKKYIAGHDLPDYPALLANAGIAVKKTQPGAAWIGDYQFRPLNPPGAAQGGGRGAAPSIAPLTINSVVLVGSPMYDAGLERGDRIIALDGKELGAEADFRAAIAAHKPGDKVTISFEGRAGRRDAAMTVSENPAVQVIAFEDAGMDPTDQQLAFRAKWLSTRQP
jgi:predicted metalloprotease with PDZ domain